MAMGKHQIRGKINLFLPKTSMARKLPTEIQNLILFYLPPRYSLRKRFDPYFWPAYIATRAGVPVAEVLAVGDKAKVPLDPVALAGYFNLVMLSSERYLSPVQCYMYYLNIITKSDGLDILNSNYINIDNII